MNIIPAILSDSLSEVELQLHRIATETNLKRVQIDIVDGEFADNITVTPIDLISIDTKSISIDIHLMTNEPSNDVVECSQVPGISLIIGQVEHMGSQKDFIEHVKSFHLKAGLSLDRYTPIESLDIEQLKQLDCIQVMGIAAGEQGRAFGGEPIFQKIEKLSSLVTSLGLKSEILVDGGIKPDTAKGCIRAGATGIVVGSYLWNSSNLQTELDQLSQLS